MEVKALIGKALTIKYGNILMRTVLLFIMMVP